MLPMGGSYVSLVPPAGCGSKGSDGDGSNVSSTTAELTMVVQTMSYGLSKCYGDSHEPFTVQPQNATFKISAILLAALQLCAGANSNQPVTLFVRRTQLFQNNTDDPYYTVDAARRTNRYFVPQPSVTVSSDGVFSLSLGVDEIVTVSTVVTMHRGDDSAANDGLPLPPASTAWPTHVIANLTGFVLDAPLVTAIPAIDQQGVWEVSACTNLKQSAHRANM